METREHSVPKRPPLSPLVSEDWARPSNANNEVPTIVRPHEDTLAIVKQKRGRCDSPGGRQDEDERKLANRDERNERGGGCLWNDKLSATACATLSVKCTESKGPDSSNIRRPVKRREGGSRETPVTATLLTEASRG